jgi:hypothetical protein
VRSGRAGIRVEIGRVIWGRNNVGLEARLFVVGTGGDWTVGSMRQRTAHRAAREDYGSG